ncbi:MAG: RrF2 family transcriptional regulator [Planctomycetota bacterium]
MTHLYTRASEYGLLALQAMGREPDRYWTVEQICEQAHTPPEFTRKVLRQLVTAGILESVRGPTGGFILARPPGEIRLIEVILGLEKHSRFDRCILGFGECTESQPCALHYMWSPIKAKALHMLTSRNVKDLASAPIAKWEAPTKRGSRRKASKSASRRRP